MTCKFCELETDSAMIYHEDCVKCEYCEHEVQYSLAMSQKENGHKPYHPPCRSKALDKIFSEKPVTITQRELDDLNKFNLMFRPNLELSIKANQYEAELALDPAVADQNLDQLGMTLKRMEAITAKLSIVLSKHKDTIRLRAEERDRARFEEVKEIRAGYTKKKDDKRKTYEDEAPEVKKEKKRLNTLDRAKENVLKFYMDTLKMTRMQAESMYEGQQEKGKIQ